MSNGKIDYEKIYRFNCTTSSSRTATVDITSIINMLNQIGSSNSYRPIKVSFYGFTTGEVVSGEFMNVFNGTSSQTTLVIGRSSTNLSCNINNTITFSHSNYNFTTARCMVEVL